MAEFRRDEEGCGGVSTKDVFVGSRTHELRVFTGSAEDAREFAAGLVEQLRDQGPASRNPYIPPPPYWTPEGWRDSKNESALHFRQGVTSCTWFGPAGFEIRIEDAVRKAETEGARAGVSAETSWLDAIAKAGPAIWQAKHADTDPGVSAEGDGS